MIIRGNHPDQTVEVETAGEVLALTFGDNLGRMSVTLDANHAEALETAIRAARLELQARAVGP